MMNSVRSKSIFVSGCGGGYDIFGGIPFYFKMKSNGNNDVTLINYTFTTRALLTERSVQLTTLLFRVDPTTDISWLTDDVYFPEQRLANQLQVSIYAIICKNEETRIELILEAYRYLIQGRTIDELILLDCGSDILLMGTEQNLGTPDADMSHARAIQLLTSDEVKSKYIIVVGPDMEVGHHVLQSDIDARLADLSPHATFTWVWQYEDEGIRRYMDVFFACCPWQSVLHSLLCAALQGHRGYYMPKHLQGRIDKSTVALHDKTCLSIGYHFDDVMHDNIYFERLTGEMNLNQVHDVIYGTEGYHGRSGFNERA